MTHIYSRIAKKLDSNGAKVISAIAQITQGEPYEAIASLLSAAAKIAQAVDMDKVNFLDGCDSAWIDAKATGESV